ncbi:hypothetical protein DSO57_1022892 [Entomophthora muscae]|uniref:Uncharacterized protein n=2 Tax=Entomophthora muscae TaxID=34485 RepID=A0ACC2T3A6_9FUNG|nr:hypothetical protein DSO57_1022892 [Entomophthora muscae]
MFFSRLISRSLNKRYLKPIINRRYLSSQKMADDAYLAMLNKATAINQELNQCSIQNQPNHANVETFDKSPKTRWVTALTCQSECSAESTSQYPQTLSAARQRLLSASKDVTFYSESDFAFEFFSIPQEFDSLPSPQAFYDAISKLPGSSVPAQVRLNKKSADDFFADILEEADGKEHEDFERFYKEWKDLVASQGPQSSVITIKDEGSEYMYYFLAIFHNQSKLVFGLATAGIQT